MLCPCGIGVCVTRSAADPVVAFCGNDFQSDFQGVAAVVRQDQGQVEMDVLEKERFVTKLFRGDSPCQFQVTGGGEYDFAIHAVIAEPGELVQPQRGLPHSKAIFRDQ